MADAARSTRCGRHGADRGPAVAHVVSGLPRPPRSAFTLLELILVLMIIGLGASLAAARLSSMRGTVGADMAAQTLVDQARRCQLLAASSGQNVRLRLDLTTRSLHIALLDGAKEQKPGDGGDDQIALSQSADELTVEFARGDAVKAGTKGSDASVDLLFSPDRRCDPAGIVTFTASNHVAFVRLSAGARLPALLVDNTNSSSNRSTP